MWNGLQEGVESTEGFFLPFVGESTEQLEREIGLLSKMWPISYLDAWKIPFSRRRRMFQLLREFNQQGDTRNPSAVMEAEDIPERYR